jgi:outer membrane protein assembly factor BamB
VAAGKRIHIVNERGIFQTIDPEAPEGKVTQEIELKETVLTTPAISNGAIYVRSDWEALEASMMPMPDESRAGAGGA